MNILIVGSGAREHAIARALKKSSKNPTLFCCAASHHLGIRSLTKNYWVGNICYVDEVVKIASDWKIDLAIIGPEAPLEKAIVDALWRKGIATIGPKQSLAHLETSKSFTRDLLKKNHIPGSPRYATFHDLEGIDDFLRELGEESYVIKANGLMSGKGVKVAGDHLQSFQEAYSFCEELIALNQTIVIEEKLIGQEFSLLSFCDGEHLIPMPLVQDHKRAFEFDLGPNTGGMGSYSDVNHLLPFVTEVDVNAAQKINQAVIQSVQREWDEKYIGILYGSFMATKEGVKLIEYNARFGDPEVMNILAILESDLVAIFESMISGTLSAEQVRFSRLATVCKYAVPEGYPHQPVKNALIDLSLVQDPERMYLGSLNEADGKLYTGGSRSVAVVGVAETIAEAEMIAEQEINRIQGPLYHRKDIGTKTLIDSRFLQMQQLRGVEKIVV